MTSGARLAWTVAAQTLRAHRRDAAWLATWSLAEAMPVLVSGRAVAGAADGFLAGRAGTPAALGWLGLLVVAALTGSIGSRQTLARLGALVEPLRDDLVRRVVGTTLRRAVALTGPPDTAAVARITHQVEIVRDSFAGLVTALRTSVFTAGGALLGLVMLRPAVAAMVAVPVLAAFAASGRLMRVFAVRQRAFLQREEWVAAEAGTAASALRDITACGAQQRMCTLLGAQVQAQALAERAVARVAALRAFALAVGCWLPLLLVAAAARWLIGHGMTVGTVIGALAYIGGGLHVALHTLLQGAARSAVRFTVTLERILAAGGDGGHGGDGTGALAARARGAAPAAAGHGGTGPWHGGPGGNDLLACGLTFGYSDRAEPVVSDLDLEVTDGDHLAIVGPSGAGKSTLACLLTGMLRPTRGQVLLGGISLAAIDPAVLARRRVLIPQEAYVFAGTLAENLAYLNPAARARDFDRAAIATGLVPLAARLGGYDAPVAATALSAGERQLIALTRAYLSTARVVVLDEATCHLDPAAEARAEQAFARRPGSLIVIAHRMSSALRARRVLVLDGARAEVGEHWSLRATSPLYADLVGHWDAGTGQAPVSVRSRQR